MGNSVKNILKRIGNAFEVPWKGIDQLISLLPVSNQKQQVFMEKKYGVFGTLLFHLFVFALFLLFNIGRPAENTDDSWIQFDLMTIEELLELEFVDPQESQQDDRNARNIAVNQAEDRIERYDDYENYRLSNAAVEQLVESRINQAVEEIIEENDLNPDDSEIPDLAMEPLDFYQAQEREEEQVYEGPTNIYFELENRKVSYLHVPVYKCEGSATIRIDIRVGQRGKVELATFNQRESDSRESCFIQAARSAALRTRFNFDSNAPRLQSGYIIYHFIAQ